MSKINKIILLFVGVVLGMTMLTWQVLKTEYFASLVSNYVAKKVEERIDYKLSFTQIEFDLFPPGTTFKNVKMKSKNSNIDVHASTVGVYFNIFDLIGYKVSIDKVLIEDGRVILKNLENSKKSESDEFNLKTLKISKIYDEYRTKIYSFIPLNLKNIYLKKIDLKYGANSVWVNDLYVNLRKSYLGVGVNIENIEVLDQEVDSLAVYGELSKSKLRINNFSISHKFNRINGSGEMYSNPRRISGKLNYVGNLKRIPGINKYMKDLDVDGILEINTDLSGDYVNPNIKARGNISDLKSTYAILDSVDFQLEKNINEIILKHAFVKKGPGSIVLNKEVKLFDEEEIIERDLSISFNKFRLNDALYFLPNLSPIKGLMTGKANLKIDNEKLSINVSPNSIVENFKLYFGGKNNLIENERIKVEKLIITPDYKGETKLEISVKFGEKSSLKSKGSIRKNLISFESEKTFVSMKDLGAISGFYFDGEGPIKLNVYGDTRKDVFFNLDASLDSMNILNFEIGKLTSNVKYSIAKNKLTFFNGTGFYKDTKYRVNGDILFGEEDENLKLMIEIPTGSFASAKEVYRPIIDPLDFIPDSLMFPYSAEIYLGGKFGLSEMRVNGNIKGRDLEIWEEELDFFKLKFKFEDKVISFKDIIVNENDGTMSGNYKYDLKNNKYVFDGKIRGIKLSDFNFYNILKLGLDSDFNYSIKGNGQGKKVYSNTNVNFFNSTIGTNSISNSNFQMNTDGDSLIAKAQFLDGRISGDILLNWGEESDREKSELDFNINRVLIKDILGILSNHNTLNDDLTGIISMSGNSKFDLNNWRRLNANLRIEDFFMRDGRNRVKLDKRHRTIKVEDGKIIDWKILLSGGVNYLSTEGVGSFLDDFKITNTGKIDTNYFNYITPEIVSSKGMVEGNFLFYGNKDDLDIYSKVTTDNSGITFKLREIPGTFENIKMILELENNNLKIRNSDGKYGRGDFSIDGGITFLIPYPKVNLNINIKNSSIPFFNRSSALTTSNLKLIGDKIPYDLIGNVILEGANITDELDEIANNKNVGLTNKYLPQESTKRNLDLINTKIDVITTSPVIVKNTLMELHMEGAGKLSGPYRTINYDGTVKAVRGNSKFKFRGHEFIISEGEVNADNINDLKDTQLRFVGNAQVNNYKILVSVDGTVKNFNIELSSEPSLPKEEILSLLALGFTSDISKNLQDQDRQNVTGIGVGTIVMDRLKLNEELSESFGVNLSILPEFVEDDSKSLINKGDNSTSRFKSTTKIKVKKKISEKVDLSLSSTVGGSIDQKQEMNLDFNVGKNITLQGVYEVKSNENDEGEQTPNSIGADIKWRWSFK